MVSYSMVFFLNQMINGLTVGAVYALVALGYTMVYGVMRLINFAHGEFFMIGSYLGYTTLVMVLADSGLPLWLMLLIATAASTVGVAILGVSVEQVAYRPLEEVRPPRCSGVSPRRIAVPAERRDVGMGSKVPGLPSVVGS